MEWNWKFGTNNFLRMAKTLAYTVVSIMKCVKPHRRLTRKIKELETSLGLGLGSLSGSNPNKVETKEMVAKNQPEERKVTMDFTYIFSFIYCRRQKPNEIYI